MDDLFLYSYFLKVASKKFYFLFTSCSLFATCISLLCIFIQYSQKYIHKLNIKKRAFSEIIQKIIQRKEGKCEKVKYKIKMA